MNDNTPTLENVKTCSKCKESKPRSEFHRRKNRGKNGLKSRCKSCRDIDRIAYRQTEAGKISQRKAVHKYQATPIGKTKRKQAAARYRDTPTGRLKKREADIRYQVRYRASLENDLKIRARRKVSTEITAGRMPAAKTLNCDHCGVPAKQYHHPSYLEENWLDVIPLCISCHVEVHNV